MSLQLSVCNGRLLMTILAVVVLLILTSLTWTGPARAHDASEEAMIELSASSAEPGELITVMGSGFRVGTETSFIYTSTITVVGMPIAAVTSVDPASGYLHAGRTTDSGLSLPNTSTLTLQTQHPTAHSSPK